MVFENHSVIIQALRKGLIEHEASDTGGVPRWKSSCPDRLAEATDFIHGHLRTMHGCQRICVEDDGVVEIDGSLLLQDLNDLVDYLDEPTCACPVMLPCYIYTWYIYIPLEELRGGETCR